MDLRCYGKEVSTINVYLLLQILSSLPGRRASGLVDRFPLVFAGLQAAVSCSTGISRSGFLGGGFKTPYTDPNAYRRWVTPKINGAAAK